MARVPFSALIVLTLFLFACSESERGKLGIEKEAHGAQGLEEPAAVLKASVAGMFYPSNPEKLKSDILHYMESAGSPEVAGEIIAAIVPHAGYIYSGPVAAHAYKAIAAQVSPGEGKGATKPDAVVILAFSHRGGFPGVSVYYKGLIETPLGQTRVSEGIADQLIASNPLLSFSQRIHTGEHSAEVQFPFIQTILPGVPMIPVVFGRQTVQNIEAVSDALSKAAEKNRIVVVATTDLCHYYPYERANAIDSKTVEVISQGDPRKMARYVSEHSDRMCGPGPVLAVMSYAENQGARPVVLKYANSGDTAGDKSGVVGYAAVVFVNEGSGSARGEKELNAGEDSQNQGESSPDYDLTEAEKHELLNLARRSLESYVREGKILKVDPPGSETLRRDGAAFVTLRKQGRLRGCIGHIEAIMPLYQNVIEMAVAAASQDHRFRRVRPEELDEITIEISVNTPLSRVSGAEEIVLGKHGVVVEKGLRRGVFLPQVATETGWTKDEFLRNLCAHKAGLPPNAYKKDAHLYVFRSIVFEEGHKL